MTSGEGILSSTGFPTPLLITPSGKAAPRRPDPGIRRRIQIGTLRPIRVDHTKCLQVAIKIHSFITQTDNPQKTKLITQKVIKTRHDYRFLFHDPIRIVLFCTRSHLVPSPQGSNSIAQLVIMNVRIPVAQ